MIAVSEADKHVRLDFGQIYEAAKAKWGDTLTLAFLP
jgi:hypothetical protein